ncbi:MAG: two-component regulator propeller domain-containing protein [Paludibacter sp.]|nr:two-component regulator propeller domain-containing protein [Paludibacter sp.]
MRKTLLAILFVLPLLLHSAETHPTIEHITSNEGLSHNTVRCMLLDRTGFLWFGTLNGLNRYDGIRMKTIIPETRNPNSLTSGKIKELIEDSHGHIWVRTYSDIFHCYDPKTESFLPIFDKKEDFFIKHNSFYEDKDGNVWLGSAYDGCVKFTFQEDDILLTHYAEDASPNKLPSNTINQILQDKNKNTWILTASGLVRLTPDGQLVHLRKATRNEVFINAYELGNSVYLISENGRIYDFSLALNTFAPAVVETQLTDIHRTTSMGNHFLLLSSISKGIIIVNTETGKIIRGDDVFEATIRGNAGFHNDKRGGIWISDFSGNVWSIDEQLNTFQLQLVPPALMKLIDDERFQFTADEHNNVWISTYGNGLFSYNRTTGVLQHYPSSRYPDNLNSNYLLTLLTDSYGHLWVGTENMGVNKLSFTNRNVQQVFPDPDNLVRNGNVIRTLFEDRRGSVWVGTKAGNLYRYSSDFRTRTTVFENSYSVYAMYEDKQGTLWIGTRGNGVLALEEGKTTVSKNYRNQGEHNDLSDNNVFGLTADRKGRLWVATFGGGVSVRVGDGFKSFFENDEWNRFARHIFLDSKGKMWVGTSNGVMRFYPDSLLADKNAYEYFTFDSQDESSLSNPEVRYIFEDANANVWLATAGGGLNLFTGVSPNGNGKFRVFKNPQGIANDNIVTIQEDTEQNLWIGTERGLLKFNPATTIFQFYKFSNDFAANIFTETAGITCKDGRMIWGSLNGFYVFHPSDVQNLNNRTNKVIITGFSVFNDPALIAPRKAPLKTSSTFAKEVSLSHSDQVFHVEFSTLDFEDPSSNQFMYMLENYERRWNISTGENNMATYRNVPPGEYVFRVKSINSEGIWDENETRLLITIRPPYWKSPLAYWIYFLLIIAAVYAGIRIALNFYRLDNAVRVERQLTDYKLRFFTNISHEFRTPLTLIKGSVDTLAELKPKMSESLRKVVNDIDINTSHLMRLIEQLLEFRKLQNNKQKLNLQRVDAVVFLENIFKSFENVAAKTNIRYNFICSEQTLPVYFDTNKVDKIVFNLLSNALKFTPRGGQITLEAEADQELHVIRISVADNGIGIPKEKQDLLFSRFMQINFSQQGTGIGLHLVSEFTALHQGKVNFRENEGGGSVFTVELPLDNRVYQPDDFVNEEVKVTTSESGEVYSISEFIEEDLSEGSLELVPLVPVAGHKFKILIIDDNDDIREFLDNKLNPYFDIITAAEGNEGVERSAKDDPDLIICDVMMPGMNGFELTKKLKDDFETCHIPVILLTAYISDEHVSEGVEAGADAYITKPFSMKFLMLQINKLLEKREKLHQYYATNPARSDADADAGNEAPCSAMIVEGEEKPMMLEKDCRFLQQVEETFEKHLSDPDFTVDDFARLLNTGRTLFFKKIKSLTGYSPNEFIRIRRMQKAAELLKTYKYNVSEVSYLVGINDPFYFSKCFKAQFGSSPSKYMNS